MSRRVRTGAVVALTAATSVAGVVAPSTASAASSRANPSCAAVWAHAKNVGMAPGPLGLGNKYVVSGFAAGIAQSKYSDGFGYCFGAPE